MYQVNEIMNQEVLAISSDATVAEAIHFLLEHQISGMPVTDSEGRLVGIISEFQLLETIYLPELNDKPVSDLMTKDVLTIEPTARLSDAASLFIRHRIRRLPVVEDGKMIGVVSRRDLLRYTEQADTKSEAGCAAMR